MIDRDGSAEELIVGATDSNGNGYACRPQIRDLIGNNYGQVHIPLRKDWKKRLVNRKKQLWYPVCVESNVDASAKKDAVLMS
ncbi:hypothetical protein GQ600_4989 [Phytophthora cactorum]|nr:hypothetical protein GQ600_4989 [Phytophthora cactorum]